MTLEHEPLPTTIAECETRLSLLADSIQDIQLQLADKDRRGPDGRRLSEIAYHTWRRNALAALHAKTKQIRQLKQWRKQRWAEQVSGEAAPEGSFDIHLLFDVLSLLRRWSEDMQPVTEQEQDVINRLQRRLFPQEAGRG